MKLLTTLTAIANLFNRLLDKFDEYDRERKRLRREERRASVADNPDKAFADLFGQSEPDGVRKPTAEQGGTMRSDSSKAPVDKNR